MRHPRRKVVGEAWAVKLYGSIAPLWMTRDYPTPVTADRRLWLRRGDAEMAAAFARRAANYDARLVRVRFVEVRR